VTGAPAHPIAVDPAIAARVRLLAVEADSIQAGPAPASLRAAIRSACGERARLYGGSAPAEIAGVSAARTLYRSFGIDPTHTRPSSEALLRRVIHEKPFPEISAPVDLCNLCALLWLLPIGLYDRETLQGDIALRRGEPGEGYEGIRKVRVDVGGRPVLSDRSGAFGNPTSDSLRTAVTAGTRSLLMVVFAPADMAREALAARGEEASALIREHLQPPEAATPIVTALYGG